MGIFFHRLPVPSTGKYPSFRNFIREDFKFCCAYCLFSEDISQGDDGFQLDHFKPKSLSEFMHLIHVYNNIYYSCYSCNKYKGPKWPDKTQQSMGMRFIDMCTDKFSDHFQESDDGFWEPLTPAAVYTEQELRLNRRSLMKWRARLRKYATALGLPMINWDKPASDQILVLLDAKTRVI